MKINVKHHICLIALLVICIIIGSYKKYKESFTQEDDKGIPKIIWTYWNTEELPEFIQKCIATVKKHNPSWQVNIVNDDNIKNYIDVDINQYKFIDSHARRSDVIRCLILAKYGGVWSDASIIMYKHLEELPLKQYEFIGYYLDGFTTNMDYPVLESWFFACVPGCKFMQLWKDAFLDINNFDSVELYLEHIKATTDLQKLHNPAYLTIHAAAQYVLQNKMSKYEIKEKMHFLKAEDGPLKYLVDNNWYNEQAVQSICESDKSNIIFYKLRSTERPFAEKNDCIFE